MAADVDVDPIDAARAVADIAGRVAMTEALAAEALAEQLEAGVGLEAAISALVATDRERPEASAPGAPGGVWAALR